jgi:hypothetical protein
MTPASQWKPFLAALFSMKREQRSNFDVFHEWLLNFSCSVDMSYIVSRKDHIKEHRGKCCFLIKCLKKQFSCASTGFDKKSQNYDF